MAELIIYTLLVAIITKVCIATSTTTKERPHQQTEERKLKE